MAMSDSERQRKRREELRRKDLKPIFVRGKDGEFDERIRVALAVKQLANNQDIPQQILEKIINTAADVFPDADLVTKKYIRKLIANYLAYKGN